MNTAFFSFESSPLRRQDLIEFEPLLKKSLRDVIAFNSYSLIFPTSPPKELSAKTDYPYGRATLEEDRLNLPLYHHGTMLATFSARVTEKAKIRKLLPHLPLIASLCLEQILLRKQIMTDPQTGLFNRSCLLQAMTKEISDILGSIMPGPTAVADDILHSHSACFGLILIDLDRFKLVNENYGHLFGDKLLRLAAECLQKTCPKQTLVSRLGGDSFAVLWPQASRNKLAELAQDIGSELGKVAMQFTPLREEVNISACLGYVNYPQDFQGSQFQKDPEEQCRLVLEKAEKALVTAKYAGRGQIYSFRQILAQGGIVLETMPMNRLVINLGRSVDAREGQRFLIWSRKFNGRETIMGAQGELVLGHYPPMYKGEISLVEIQDEMSIAEILFLSDPNWSVEKGDKLTLLDEHSGLMEQHDPQPGGKAPQKDLLTGLFPYRDFLQVWHAVRGQSRSFSIILIRLESLPGERSPMEQMKEEHFFQALSQRAENLFGPDAVGGRYSMNGVIYHVPGMDQEHNTRTIHELLDDERLKNLDLTVGIAEYPFLDCTRSEILENAHKALDHASMLQETKIACFDSISLTISADRLFAQGDLFDAINEYKKALTADDENFLARNSLGICYARLNKHSKARTIFQELIERHPDHVMPRYNFGCACLKDGDADAATKAFAEVLSIQPDHLYTLVRLGLMAEEAGDFEQAWDYYSKVRVLPDGERLAVRYLARLAFRSDDRDTAREFLHQAITANPQDAYSFHLLAKIYLERGDDPEIAESLARQSVHLKPDSQPFWEVLITALEQQGKTEEVQQTKIRAASQTS